MLADDDAAVSDQSLGSLVLSGDVEPGVGVLHLHGDIGNDALHAKEERGVARDDFCVRISADIADLDLAVSILVLVFDLAFVDELLQLHTGDDAADVAGFIDAGEGVVEVVEARSLGGIAGHCNKLHIGIFLSSLQAEGLMAVGVGDDDLAALVNAVDASVIAGLVFADGVFPDDVVLADAQNLGGFLDTLDMGVGVAFVFVADQNDADLDVGADSIAGGLSRSLFLGGSLGLFSGGFGGLGGFSRSGLGRGVVRLGGGSAGNQREDHDYGEKQSDDLFHVFVPPKKFCDRSHSPAVRSPAQQNWIPVF